MKLLFLGTPEFAVTVLKRLLNSRHKVLGVISQPDREKDKKGRLLPTPVKAFALQNGLACHQFEKVSAQVDFLRAQRADLLVTAAYGQLLSQEVLTVAPLGVWNVHASLLPRYRGSSPVQSALLNGEKQTGVTIMQTVQKMDAGDILAAGTLSIEACDNAVTLQEKLAALGGELLVNTLDRQACGEVTATPQDGACATVCKKIVKEDGRLCWTESAERNDCRVRAMYGWPMAYFTHGDRRIKVYEAEPCDGSGAAGQVLCADERKGLIVACATGALRLKRLQAPGKKVLSVQEFLRGYSFACGEMLES